MNKKKRPGRSISEDVVRQRCDELGLIYVRKYVEKEKTRVVYLCPRHLNKGEIVSAWTHLRTGKYGCPYCTGKNRTTNDFKQTVSKILPEITVIGEYESVRSKILVRCNVCGHEWSPASRSLLGGEGCPICAKEKRAKSRRKSQQDFESDLRSVSPNIIVLGEYKGTHSKIKCRCIKHNNEWESFPSNLLNGSAGCPMCAIERFNNTPSKGEQIISKWLDLHEIEYECERVMDGCTYKRPLRFDFYLPIYNMAIEYDGEQHFKPVGWYEKNTDGFMATRIRDAIKNTYCKENGIYLLRIPYTEYNRIPDILDYTIKKEDIQPH